jgi:hypothetical protein
MNDRKLYKFCPFCHAIWEIRLEDKEDAFRTCPICGHSDHVENEQETMSKYWRRNGIDSYFLGRQSHDY